MTLRPRYRSGSPAVAYLFIAPALVAIGIFFVVPIVAAFMMSFTDFDIYALGSLTFVRFVALENYLRALDAPLFWQAIRNTFYFVLVGGPLSVAVSLGIALMVNSRLARFKSFFRTIYFLPVVTSLVAVAIVWRYVYHPRAGLLNYVLSFFGVSPVDWLGNPDMAMPAIILLAVWKNFGYNMLIFIAGLQNIQDDLYDAARIDGAGVWKQFLNVTVPMLAPTTVFIVVITVIGYFQLFAEPYVMTQGGPLNSTLSLVMLMYEQGFRWWSMGYAASIAFLLFLIILVFTAIQIFLRRRALV